MAEEPIKIKPGDKVLSKENLERGVGTCTYTGGAKNFIVWGEFGNMTVRYYALVPEEDMIFVERPEKKI